MRADVPPDLATVALVETRSPSDSTKKCSLAGSRHHPER
jgi:hypothetical protein